MGLLPLCSHVVVCVCVRVRVRVRSCNWLKLKTRWTQLTHVGKVSGMFWGNSYIFLSGNFAFLPNKEKLLQKLNKHWSTTCSQYLHARCVKHVRNTTELSKASSQANKSDKSREIGSLACLVTIQQLLHDPKPLGAQTRGKYTEKKQEEKTLGHMWLFPWLFAFCSLFLWGFAGGPPVPDPKGFLYYTSPI